MVLEESQLTIGKKLGKDKKIEEKYIKQIQGSAGEGDGSVSRIHRH